jgi:CheY-like chemotaxis protein
MSDTAQERKPRLLAVDDSPDSAGLLVRIAVGCGYDADFVTDPQQATEMAKSWQPDVIALDLGMPVVDGVDVIVKLEELRYRGAVIIVSGLSRLQREQAVNIARSRGLNVLDHLGKPVQLQSMRGLLNEVQERKPPKRSPIPRLFGGA